MMIGNRSHPLEAIGSRRWLAALFLPAFFSPAPSRVAADAPVPTRDEHTQLLLRVDPTGSELEDAAGGARVVSTGATIERDPVFGYMIRLAADVQHQISVEDGGRFDFKQGFTFEAWVRLTAAKTSTDPWGSLAVKGGSFAFRLGENLSFDNQWMIFPRWPIVTTDEEQIDYFPVDNGSFGGSASVPTGQWTHLAVTYDPGREVIHSWIDGGQDRVCYLTRDTGTTLQVDPRAPLVLFSGRQEVRLGAVRISGCARTIGPIDPLEMYVHQVPYQDRIVLQFTHLGQHLPYPLQTSVTWENPNGPASVIHRGTLPGPADTLVELEQRPGWHNDYYQIHVRVTAAHQQIYSRMTRVANARVPANPRITVRRDKRISINGKAVFPRVIYHAFPEDFQELADMGFDYVTPRAPGSPLLDFGRKTAGEFAAMRHALDAAQAAGLQLILPARISLLEPVFLFQDHPALGAWAAYDEPWGLSLDKMNDSYNAIKMINQEVPVICPQNNLSRMRETAEGVDILVCDPYPIPLLPLRTVPEAIRTARQAVADLKPVWTLLDQYGSEGGDKRPSLQELRCMLYLSIAAGADGIGIYAWDDRTEGPEGRRRWYTRNHPEDLAILRAAMKELTAIEQVLLIPNNEQRVTITHANPAIHVAMKTDRTGRYLVIANDSRGPEQATVSLEGVGDATAVNLADGSHYDIVDGSLKLQLAPLAAGAYLVE